DLA
ncbi:carbohydrate phosphorylase family protein, partial [Chlamydia psittaci 84-8471/1]